MATVNGTTLTITGPIQIKRGTQAALEASGYVPAAGELVGAKDTGILKMGDGVNTWKQLPGYDGTEVVNSLTENVVGKALDATQGKALNNRLASLEGVTGIDCGEIEN
ncbi:MAG: hypothetical protein IJQ57_00100 [Synergistaceae bacterium]|nr:hypothetical protein [Synergistaceae bacterium]